VQSCTDPSLALFGFKSVDDRLADESSRITIKYASTVCQANEIADSLNKHYQARINDPIIEDKEPGGDDKPRLFFPKICDAFIPQAFQVLRQAGASRHLEDASTWSGLPRRNDLGAFLLSYLSSPYSTETPLLVLGHPGSCYGNDPRMGSACAEGQWAFGGGLCPNFGKDCYQPD
jgi:hypothetical protein